MLHSLKKIFSSEINQDQEVKNNDIGILAGLLIEAANTDGKITDEEMILVTAVGYPRSGNRMNLIQTHSVADIVQTLNWRR